MLSREDLIQKSLSSGESEKVSNGAILIDTGKRTGRSPDAKFIVRDALTADAVDWAKNNEITQEKFDKLWDDALVFKGSKVTYRQNLTLCHDHNYAISVTAETDLATHSLFVKNMFIDREFEIEDTKNWQLLSLAKMQIDPKKYDLTEDGLVAINFSQRKVLICGMMYSGEIKKAFFSVLNFILTEQDVLPMHCAASEDSKGRGALFFGLSGTGKTTLSSDSNMRLIGDDEHGWSKDGIFNFEGGCYAKCIDLTEENESLIWGAISKGAILENVILDANKTPDYTDDRKTKNTRVSYPLSHVKDRVDPAVSGHPASVIFLSCDLYGVLPALSMLNYDQALYYFLSGYTALVGSTEMGSNLDVSPAFSACFGAPFFARYPVEYANILKKRLIETRPKVYLINTGWYGGGYGVGSRYPLQITRKVVQHAMSGAIKDSDCWSLPGFDFLVPNKLDGIDARWLDPRVSWQSLLDYEKNSQILKQAFIENMSKLDVSHDIFCHGPSL